MNEQHEKKQFIAGAVCPQCKRVDTIMLISGGERQRRECIDCDFADSLDALGQAAVPLTRLDIAKPGSVVAPGNEADATTVVDVVDLTNPGEDKAH